MTLTLAEVSIDERQMGAAPASIMGKTLGEVTVETLILLSMQTVHTGSEEPSSLNLAEGDLIEMREDDDE